MNIAGAWSRNLTRLRHLGARTALVCAVVVGLTDGNAGAAPPSAAGTPPTDVGFIQLLLRLRLPAEAGREADRLTTVRGADALPKNLAFEIGMASAVVGDAKRAVDFLNHASASTDDPGETDKWQLASGVALLRAKTFPHALQLFARVEAFGNDPAMRLKAARLGCVAIVMSGDTAGARACIHRFVPKTPASHDTSHLLEALDIDPHTRFYVGGTLSAVVPGLGQLTAGRTANGALALLLNGATVTATYVLLSGGSILDGSLFALGIGLRYYLGNINNGAIAWREAAHHRRAKATRTLLEILAQPGGAAAAPDR